MTESNQESSTERFVRIWCEAVKKGKTPEWVAEQCGSSSGGSARARASYLRTHGVPDLPTMPMGTRKRKDPKLTAKLRKIVAGAK